MSNSTLTDIYTSEGEDHHQGLARTHLLSDGSIYWFLANSEVGTRDQGSLSVYRFAGECDGEHVLQTAPLTVAPMQQLLMIDERHPSDITLLPEVNGADAGYLFVTEEDDNHRVSVYRWRQGENLQLQGRIPKTFAAGGPNFLFVDKVDSRYCLGIAGNNWGTGDLYWADEAKLFPASEVGTMDVSAFEPDPAASGFGFPVLGCPCQTKLVRDSTGAWSLLPFRSDPNDSETGTDYVDLYSVTFSISDRICSVHIAFNAGDTGFASTGTHHVEATGRLLVSSSYRWAEDEGHGSSSFVSRVDECPSWTASGGGSGSGSGGGSATDRPPHRQK